MASKFYPITVIEVRQETAGCVSVLLDIPANLQPQFAYTQGQYLTVKAIINGVEVRRNYSLCSSPLSGQWRVAIKWVQGGVFSTFANQHLQPGHTIEAMPPLGNFFTPLHPSKANNYLAFAAGSGITPLLSIIETTLQTEPFSNFTLVYGNKNRSSIIFKEALEGIKNKYIHRFRVIHVLSQQKTDAPINHGRIDEAKCALLFQTLVDVKKIDTFFICGPEQMIFSVKNHLQQLGVLSHKIHFELFGTQKNNAQTRVSSKDVKEEGLVSNITIKLDGIEQYFNLAYEGKAILDAALHHGTNLPYACKAGMCCTCKAKLIKGQVTMDANYALEAEELSAGYILTCQSHPTTPVVVVDFDAV